MDDWVVVIGGSAGAVEALTRFCSGLEQTFPAPIVIVIHFPEHAVSHLSEILNRTSLVPAVQAKDGDILTAGCIYIAPPGYHTLVQHGRLRLSVGPKENGNRPAIDPLFRSALVSYGSKTCAVLLSGTLDDGTAGMMRAKECEAVCVVQDPEDALFGDMPYNAIAQAGIDHVLPATEIAAFLERTIRESRPEGELPSVRQTGLAEPGATRGSELEKRATQFTCPDCGGTLYQELEHADGLICRIGHYFSMQSLESAQGNKVEAAMWSALRILEEHISLCQRLLVRAESSGSEASAKRFRRIVAENKDMAETIRSVLFTEPQESHILGA